VFEVMGNVVWIIVGRGGDVDTVSRCGDDEDSFRAKVGFGKESNPG
jgi:hypothetical protein